MRKAPISQPTKARCKRPTTTPEGAMVIGSEKCLDLLELKYYNDIVELKK